MFIWVLVAVFIIVFAILLILNQFIKFVNEANNEYMREMADEASRMPEIEEHKTLARE